MLKSEPARCGHDNPDKQHMKSRILLADDHQLFREALCHLLNSQPDLEVAGQVGNGLEVIEQARLSEADVVCMDINMPGMDGIEITRRLIAALPQVKVVALSAYSDQQYVLDMLHAGAMAYVTKGEASDELLRAIHAVLRGRTYLCPDVAGVVAAAVVGQGGAGAGGCPPGSARAAGTQARGRRMHLQPDCRNARHCAFDGRCAPAQHHAQARPAQRGGTDPLCHQQRARRTVNPALRGEVRAGGALPENR